MTISSTFEGAISYDGNHLDADEPLNAAHAAVVGNNLQSLADGMSRPLVNWVLADNATALQLSSPFNTNRFKPLWIGAPFPLSIRPDGTPYGVRVRLRGAANATGSTITARVVLATGTKADSASDALGREDNVLQGSTTSTTHAWLNLFDSDGNAAKVVTLTPEQVARGRKTFDTTDALSGNRVSVQWVEARIEVWVDGNTTTSTKTFQLSGLHAYEVYT